MTHFRIIVLGMHRSGTSCLAGLLQQAGLYLGDVVENAPHNKKGNRENLEIRALNDDILSHNKATWESPPNKITWLSKHEKKRDQLIYKYSEIDIWGFKDPRTVLTLPFWLQGMPHDTLKFIATFRHPLAVAKSIAAREQTMSLADAITLWKHYNEKIIEYHIHYDFPLLDFDLDAEVYLQAFRNAVRLLDHPLISPNSHLDFFDDQLRNQTTMCAYEFADQQDTLRQALPLYRTLQTLSCGY